MSRAHDLSTQLAVLYSSVRIKAVILAAFSETEVIPQNSRKIPDVLLVSGINQYSFDDDLVRPYSEESHQGGFIAILAEEDGIASVVNISVILTTHIK